MHSMSRAAFFGSALGIVCVVALCQYFEANKKKRDLDSKTVFKISLPIKSEEDQKPERHKRQETERLVRRAFNVEDEVQIQVLSIVDDSFLNERVGTMCFSKIPVSIDQTTVNQRILLEAGSFSRMSMNVSLDFTGLIPLYSGSIDLQSLDIIAVPGLGGHAIGSFKAEKQDYMWLRDDLPNDLPNSSIYTYGHGTKVPDSKSFQSLFDLGVSFKNVLQNLANHNIKEGHPKRILLIGHSLGGLIIKEAVCQLSRERIEDVLGLLRGILFFGTPNEGMNNDNLVLMARGQPNEDFIRSIGNDSAELRRLGEEWHDVFKKASPNLFKNLKIFSYYETEKSPTYREIDGEWKKDGPSAKLVDRNSATHGRPFEDDNRHILPIARTHSNLIRFGPNDHIYSQHVMPTLKDLVNLSQHHAYFPLNEEEQACVKSLRFHGHKSRFDEIVETLDNTCTWFFENSKYKEWFQQRTGLLRLTGYRTSGKSTLMKRAVQNMDSHAGLVMSHFFNRQGAELQKNACGFFRSLMYQFLPYSHSSLCKAVSKYKETSDDSLWEQQWMKDTLEKEIPKACKELPMVILVDAIDECSPEEPASIMDFLQTVLSKSSGGELRICVSYSPGDVTEEADIDMAHHNREDIAKFVQTKLSRLRKCKLSVSPESERSITMEIQERAQGMFLWAEIACDKVIKMDGHGKSAQAILLAIESLPRRIDDMFLDLLKEVQRNDAKETIKLFRWICFARRPLSVEELQYAIVMDPNMKETSIKEICKNPDFRKDPSDMIRAIFHLSRGLARVVNRTIWPSSEPTQGQKKEVRLIHDCVHEFLLNRGFKELVSSCSGNGVEDVMSSGHFQLSRSCIKYLSMEERRVWTSEARNKSLQSFPFLAYAATSWLFHTEQVERAKKSQDDVLQLLQWPSTDIFNAWVTIHNIFNRPNHRRGTWHPAILHTIYPKRKPSLLHVLARHGLVSLLEVILSSNNNEGNNINVTCQAASSSAADGDQDRVVKSSFEVKRVNADEQDGDGRTPLWYAVAANKTAAAESLLKINYVNPNTKDYSGFSPFRLAALRGRGEIMEALFKLSEERLQVTAALLRDAASNLRHAADVLKILLDKKLPEVKMTEEMVDAAAKNYESGLEVMSILIQDERLEMSDSERILERILISFDMDTTNLFLQERFPGTQVSENMLAAAATNRSSGAAITESLLATGSTIPITERLMQFAAMNREQGPELMKMFLCSSHSVEIISAEVLRLATRHWRKGEEVMRILLRDERTGKIPRRVLDTAAENRDGGEMIKAFFMERRSEFLRQVRHTDCRILAGEIAQFNEYGAEVMQLLLQVGGRNLNTPRLMEIVIRDTDGANLMRVLVRNNSTKVLRLLTKRMRAIARVFWGFHVAEEVFSQGRNIELSWGLDVSKD